MPKKDLRDTVLYQSKLEHFKEKHTPCLEVRIIPHTTRHDSRTLVSIGCIECGLHPEALDLRAINYPFYAESSKGTLVYQVLLELQKTLLEQEPEKRTRFERMLG
jgi:hypothetical protein